MHFGEMGTRTAMFSRKQSMKSGALFPVGRFCPWEWRRMIEEMQQSRRYEIEPIPIFETMS